MPPRVEAVVPNSAAARAGFEPGDVIKAIDGSPITNFIAMQRTVSASAGFHPDFHDRARRRGEDADGRPLRSTRSARPSAGIVSAASASRARRARRRSSSTTGRCSRSRLGVSETYFVVDRTFSYLGKLITGRESADQLSGPIGIARVSGEVAKAGGVGGLIGLVALLSVSIGSAEPVPGSASRWRPPPLLRFRGRARPAAQRARSGDRLPDRPRPGADADAVRRLERHPQSRRFLGARNLRPRPASEPAGREAGRTPRCAECFPCRGGSPPAGGASPQCHHDRRAGG